MMVTRFVGRVLAGYMIELWERLTDVFVSQLMRETNTLGLMLDRLTIHDGMFELFYNRFVDCVALTRTNQQVIFPFQNPISVTYKILNGTRILSQYHGS